MKKKITFQDWFNKTKPEGVSNTAYMKQLSEKIAVSHETLRHILGGMTPSYKHAKEIEKLTGISAIELVEGIS